MTTAEINVKKKRLLSYKKILEENERAIIGTHNKIKGWDGCASFCNDGESIRVFEGNPDGSDDKTMSFYKFVRNYSFGIGVEMKGGSSNDLCDFGD